MSQFNLKLTSDKKLVSDLHLKVGYKVHIETLRLAIDLGYKVVKVHKIIQFQQETYLKDYVGEKIVINVSFAVVSEMWQL